MPIEVRSAQDTDIPVMAVLRSQEWETEAYWLGRITRYLRAESSPQHGLPSRAAFVAEENGEVVGFVAGHLTQRHQCDGELEWINVAKEQRGRGVADLLMKAMAQWFVKQSARRVCVDVDPKNATARKLYAKHGAQTLNKHWMVWRDVGTSIG
jgi:GNAT superfamily N-acetyltransferase